MRAGVNTNKMNSDQVKLEVKKHMASKTQISYKIKLPFTKYTQQEMSHEKDVIWFIVK